MRRNANLLLASAMAASLTVTALNTEPKPRAEAFSCGEVEAVRALDEVERVSVEGLAKAVMACYEAAPSADRYEDKGNWRGVKVPTQNGGVVVIDAKFDRDPALATPKDATQLEARIFSGAMSKNGEPNEPQTVVNLSKVNTPAPLLLQANRWQSSWDGTDLAGGRYVVSVVTGENGQLEIPSPSGPVSDPTEVEKLDAQIKAQFADLLEQSSPQSPTPRLAPPM